MKKQVKTTMAAILVLSALMPMTGCGKRAKTKRPQPDDCPTLDTNSYELVVPTGTVVESDEPDLPEDIVYWGPTRDLKNEYTIDEALKKYAIVVGHSTLIYTACDELQMDHELSCSDYGANRFWNDNCADFITPDGEWIDGPARYAHLKDSSCTTLSEFAENIGHLYVGIFGYYAPEDPYSPQVTIVEQTDDHVFATVKKPAPYSDEGLYYAKFIGRKLFYAEFKNDINGEELTDTDRQNFVRYATILFEHLSSNDRKEPYIYDKIVNTPILGGKYISGFDHIERISGKTIYLETREGSALQNCSLVIGADDRQLEKGIYDTDWADADGMQTREETFSGSQEFVFTIDGTRYLCRVRAREGMKIDVDSLDGLLKLIEDCCYII